MGHQRPEDLDDYGHSRTTSSSCRRTDTHGARAHDGITFLLVDMDQPGVEVRPIAMMSGESEFNEVFFTDARCPRGRPCSASINKGWAVATTLLGFERGVGATTTSLNYRHELDMFIELARANGKLDDPLVRQDIARFHTVVEIMRYRGYQALTRYLSGKTPGPESSIGKLFWSEYHKVITEAAMNLAGAAAMVGFGEETRGGIATPAIGTENTVANWIHTFLVARPGTIYAGTSEVQRNIVGERVLGLPKEPRADDGTWKESQASYK